MEKKPGTAQVGAISKAQKGRKRTSKCKNVRLIGDPVMK